MVPPTSEHLICEALGGNYLGRTGGPRSPRASRLSVEDFLLSSSYMTRVTDCSTNQSNPLEFENFLHTGGTMKVSLTPKGLKVLEVPGRAKGGVRSKASTMTEGAPGRNRLLPRAAVTTDDIFAIAENEEFLADFLSREPPPRYKAAAAPASTSSPGQADSEARTAANTGRRPGSSNHRHQSSSDVDVRHPSLTRTKSQPGLTTSSSRPRLVAKEATNRSDSSRSLIDFLSSAPPEPPKMAVKASSTTSGPTHRANRLRSVMGKMSPLTNASASASGIEAIDHTSSKESGVTLQAPAIVSAFTYGANPSEAPFYSVTKQAKEPAPAAQRLILPIATSASLGESEVDPLALASVNTRLVTPGFRADSNISPVFDNVSVTSSSPSASPNRVRRVPVPSIESDPPMSPSSSIGRHSDGGRDQSRSPVLRAADSAAITVFNATNSNTPSSLHRTRHEAKENAALVLLSKVREQMTSATAAPGSMTLLDQAISLLTAGRSEKSESTIDDMEAQVVELLLDGDVGLQP